MYQSVRDEFCAFTNRFEGRVPFMYLDVKGLVTVGYGNLIDPLGAALGLPFERKDTPGQQVTTAEISAEWEHVKSRTDLKLHGGMAFGPITKLQITEEALQTLMNERLRTFEGILGDSFPSFAEWPADAQLGVLSMSWAMGPGFSPKYPHFTEACRALDWDTAADQCRMNDDGNPGLRPRNEANVVLFRNAAASVAAGFLAETLHYPRDLVADGTARRDVVRV
jgi:GH24 family phage-related lysozyme (muramidase)